MLCSSCQKQPNCLPAKLAETDDTLAQMLDHLENCNLRPNAARPSWLQKLSQVLRRFWAGLRHSFATLGRRP